MGQHHDSAPSLNYTVISIDSPHMRKDGSNYLKFLLLAFYVSGCAEADYTQVSSVHPISNYYNDLN